MGCDALLMRVFCRFAPLKVHPEVSSARHLHVSLTNSHTDTDSSPRRLLTVAEVASGSSASLACAGVYFPSNESAQEEIFEDVVVPLIEKARTGGKGSVICFGQTSTGKTHTIFGPDGGNTSLYADARQKGIVPRLADSLFSNEGGAPITSVEVRFYEIYNEIVTDLVAQLHYDIDGRPRKTQYKGVEKGKILRSLHYMRCASATELNELLLTLSEMRLVYSTDANAKSSRSHIVIQLNFTIDARDGQLTIVDLAGSESLKGSQSIANGGSTGITLASCGDIFASAGAGLWLQKQACQRRQETKNINTSLFALKRVISALYGKSRHVSFKESMLTTVLESTLNADSALIACCSSNEKDISETLATMRFAREASAIQVSDAFLLQHRSDVVRAAQKQVDTLCVDVPVSRKIVQSSAPSSVNTSRSPSTCSDGPELPSACREHTALLDNLRRLATDQRSHIDTLETEIERLQMRVDVLERRLAHTETGQGSEQFDRLDELYSSLEAMALQNKELLEEIAEQQMRHEADVGELQFSIACLKNELSLMDRAANESFPSEVPARTLSCGSAPHSSNTIKPTAVIDLDTPPSSNRASRAAEVIQETSNYISRVQSRLGASPNSQADRSDWAGSVPLQSLAVNVQTCRTSKDTAAPSGRRHRARIVQVFSPESKAWD